MQTDKLSHWLQGAALVVAVVGLWFLSRKSAGAIEQSAPAALPSPAGLSFGSPVFPGTTAGDIYVGGNPIYTTYNYPPAVPNDAGATATNDGGQAQAPFGYVPPAGGCGCGKKCPDAQLTVSGISGAYETRGPNALNNLNSLLGKGTYQYM